jgi:hypothetical protein
MAGIVAIHQPIFFPWLGYFDKIGRAEVLVFSMPSTIFAQAPAPRGLG